MRERIKHIVFLMSATLLMAGGCTGDNGYKPLPNPGTPDDPDKPDPAKGTVVVYDYLKDSKDVNVSTIWEVTVTQGSESKTSLVFQSTCPEFVEGQRGMTAGKKDDVALGLLAGRSISWTNFSFEGEVTVEARVIDRGKVPADPLVRIIPTRYGVQPQVDGAAIKFTLTQPGQYSVEVGTNGYKNGLMIFANPLEKAAPQPTTPGYLALDKAKASDVANIPSNYTGIYFKPGIHDIGIYEVPAHVKNIYIDGNAYVYGTLRLYGNPDVKISGRGTLSAARLDYRASHSIEAVKKNNIESDRTSIEGITIADFTHFSVRLISAHNSVDWVKIIGCWTYNCDGISAYHYSTVSNCFVMANDDNIKVFTDGLKFEKMVVWQQTNGNVIQMAWNDAKANDVLIKQIDILHTEWNNNGFNRGILGYIGNYYKYEGNSNDMRNYVIEDLVTETPVQVVWRVSPDPFSVAKLDGLLMKDWKVEMNMALNYKNYITCSYPEYPFKNIVFDNVVFNGTKLTAGNWISLTNMVTSNLETPVFK